MATELLGAGMEFDEARFLHPAIVELMAATTRRSGMGRRSYARNPFLGTR